VPTHQLLQRDLRASDEAWFDLDQRKKAAVQQFYDYAGVERRFSVQPRDVMARPTSLSRRMQIYREHAVGLGRKVARDCLSRANVEPQAVDLVITVSCTGMMLPSLDAFLIEELGLRHDVRRFPITGLGCAGGAAGLACAAEFIRGRRHARALVVAVELPTLTFQPSDVSTANFAASALFGDGAAAALVSGRAKRGVEIVDTCSSQIPHSLEAMGFDLETDGLHVIISKEIPALVSLHFPVLVSQLLATHDLLPEDIDAFIVHPGGRRILDAVEEGMALSAERLEPSRQVLRHYGNISSAAVLFVLETWLERQPRLEPGSFGLLAAFGPGVTVELALLRWL
jgi:predicted naringenin-chalcone synthase